MFGFLNSLFGLTHKKTELVLTQENHNPYYLKGTKMIDPYIVLSNKQTVISKIAEENIIEGIRYLDAVTQINPNNFAAYWVKGKGYQALKQHDNAYKQFDKSFAINKEDPNVARELMIECLGLGKGKEAVEISLHALTIDETDAGLVANLALAYIINDNLDLAKSTIEKAILANPSDKINLNIKRMLDEVIAGKRPRPEKFEIKK